MKPRAIATRSRELQDLRRLDPDGFLRPAEGIGSPPFLARQTRPPGRAPGSRRDSAGAGSGGGQRLGSGWAAEGQHFGNKW